MSHFINDFNVGDVVVVIVHKGNYSCRYEKTTVTETCEANSRWICTNLGTFYEYDVVPEDTFKQMRSRLYKHLESPACDLTLRVPGLQLQTCYSAADCLALLNNEPRDAELLLLRVKMV